MYAWILITIKMIKVKNMWRVIKCIYKCVCFNVLTRTWDWMFNMNLKCINDYLILLKTKLKTNSSLVETFKAIKIMTNKSLSEKWDEYSHPSNNSVKLSILLLILKLYQVQLFLQPKWITICRAHAGISAACLNTCHTISWF